MPQFSSINAASQGLRRIGLRFGARFEAINAVYAKADGCRKSSD